MDSVMNEGFPRHRLEMDSVMNEGFPRARPHAHRVIEREMSHVLSTCAHAQECSCRDVERERSGCGHVRCVVRSCQLPSGPVEWTRRAIAGSPLP